MGWLLCGFEENRRHYNGIALYISILPVYGYKKQQPFPWQGNWSPYKKNMIRVFVLAHWGQDEMDVNFQTKFLNKFPWIKMYKSR